MDLKIFSFITIGIILILLAIFINKMKYIGSILGSILIAIGIGLLYFNSRKTPSKSESSPKSQNSNDLYVSTSFHKKKDFLQFIHKHINNPKRKRDIIINVKNILRNNSHFDLLRVQENDTLPQNPITIHVKKDGLIFLKKSGRRIIMNQEELGRIFQKTKLQVLCPRQIMESRETYSKGKKKFTPSLYTIDQEARWSMI